MKWIGSFEIFNSSENNKNEENPKKNLTEKPKLKLKKAEIVISEPILEPFKPMDINVHHVDEAFNQASLSNSSSILSSTSECVSQEINDIKSKEQEESSIDKNNNLTKFKSLAKRNSIGLLLLKTIEASMNENNENHSVNVNSNISNSNSADAFLRRRASFDLTSPNSNDPTDRIKKTNEPENIKNARDESSGLGFLQKSSTFMNRRSTYDYTAQLKSPLGERNFNQNERKNIELNKNVYNSFKTSSLISYAQSEKTNGEKQSSINVS